MRRLLAKVPHLIVILLLAYVVVSMVPSSGWYNSLIAVGLILGIILVGFFIYFKWLRDRLSFLSSWPTPAMNSRIRRYLLLRDYTPRTARTRKQVVVSLLIPCLTILLFVTATSAASLFLPVSDRFRDVVYKSSLPLILGFILLNPVFHSLVFRLRTRYDLTNALLSIVIYLPIFIFVIIALIHLTSFFLDGETPFLSVTWFQVLLASYFGVIVCILTVATHRVGIDPEPAPAITAHRLYQPTEIAVSLASLAGIAAVLLLVA